MNGLRSGAGEKEGGRRGGEEKKLLRVAESNDPHDTYNTSSPLFILSLPSAL